MRGDLGFTGVIISDSLDATRGRRGWSPADRALNFLQAGGDLVLINDPWLMPAMYKAVLNRTGTDSSFKAKVDASAMRVLTAKQNRGLLAGAAQESFRTAKTSSTAAGRAYRHWPPTTTDRLLTARSGGQYFEQ